MCSVFNTKVSKCLEYYCNIIQVSSLTSPIRRNRKLQVFIDMFCKLLKHCLSVPAGASNKVQWLLIIYNKWQYYSNSFEINFPDIFILPPTLYSTSSVKSVFITTPQTLSDMASDFISLTLSAVTTKPDSGKRLQLIHQKLRQVRKRQITCK